MKSRPALLATRGRSRETVYKVGIGETGEYAVADASGGRRGFGALASDPDAGDFPVVREILWGDPPRVDGLAGFQVRKTRTIPRDSREWLFFAGERAGSCSHADSESMRP